MQVLKHGDKSKLILCVSQETNEKLVKKVDQLNHSLMYEFEVCKLDSNFQKLLSYSVEDNVFTMYYPFLEYSLRQYIQKFQLDLKQRLQICLELFLLVQSLNSISLIHHSLTLNNVFIHQNQVFLGDFSHSKFNNLLNNFFEPEVLQMKVSPEHLFLRNFSEEKRSQILLDMSPGNVWQLGIFMYSLFFEEDMQREFESKEELFQAQMKFLGKSRFSFYDIKPGTKNKQCLLKSRTAGSSLPKELIRLLKDCLDPNPFSRIKLEQGIKILEGLHEECN